MHIADMEEGGPVKPYLGERRLHSRQNPYDLSLVDIPGEPLIAGALDEKLGKPPLFNESNPRLVRGVVYQEFPGTIFHMVVFVFRIGIREASLADISRRGAMIS